MYIKFKQKINNQDILETYLQDVIEQYIKEQGIVILLDIEIVNISELKGFIGATSFETIDNKIKFTISLDSNIVTIENIKNHNSQLHITIYHELAHCKNILNLSRYIAPDVIPSAFDIDSKEDIEYKIGICLWGEFWAYLSQFQKFRIRPDDILILEEIKRLASFIAISYKRTNGNVSTMSNIINKQVYSVFYELCVMFAYGKTDYTYNNQSIIKEMRSSLHSDVTEYISELKKALYHIVNDYPEAIMTKEIFTELGKKFLLIYKLLNIDINLKNGMILNYDATQPIVEYYTKNKIV